jgi:hypothetical protein
LREHQFVTERNNGLNFSISCTRKLFIQTKSTRLDPVIGRMRLLPKHKYLRKVLAVRRGSTSRKLINLLSQSDDQSGCPVIVIPEPRHGIQNCRFRASHLIKVDKVDDAICRQQLAKKQIRKPQPRDREPWGCWRNHVGVGGLLHSRLVKKRSIALPFALAAPSHDC